MILRVALLCSSMLALGAWDWNPMRCSDIFQKMPTLNDWRNLPESSRGPTALNQPGKLLKQEFRLEYNESSAFEVLRGINRLAVEGDRSWLVREKQYTEIVLGEGITRWTWFFKMDFANLIRELQQVEMYRVDIYENGLQQSLYEGTFLKGFEIRKDEAGEPLFVIRIDPRFIKLIDSVKEPAYASMSLERGLYKVIDYTRRGYGY